VSEEEKEQLERLLNSVREVLGDNVVGVYLFGSAVHGGLKPFSDVDVMVVATQPMSTTHKRRLISTLLEISRKPRHLELTIVVESDIRPWRYPPRLEFQYGDWWREEFERGEYEPWEELNPDLASLIRMVLNADTPLQGPPPGEIFDSVPPADYIAALVHGIEALLQDLESDARNVVLTLARIWSGVATDQMRSKDTAADWALSRLPEQHRGVLAEARSIYLGNQQQQSNDFVPRARAYSEHVVAEIHKQVGPDSAGMSW
jgi:predicted nucleotidyltransferase